MLTTLELSMYLRARSIRYFIYRDTNGHITYLINAQHKYSKIKNSAIEVKFNDNGHAFQYKYLINLSFDERMSDIPESNEHALHDGNNRLTKSVSEFITYMIN